MEIKTNSESLANELERKLYCIKENNFSFDDDFKMKYNFEFNIVEKRENSDNILVELDGNIYIFSKENRIIDFYVNHELQKRFIISHEHLKNVFKELKIEYYSTKSEEKLEDSLDSEISDMEILNIFKDTNIVKIFKINSSCDKLIDKFNIRYPKKLELISNISLNAQFYYPYNCNDKIDFSIIMDKYLENIKEFICQELQSILYLIGPKGSSKSIFLMIACLYNNFMKKPFLYINHNKLKNLPEKERKNIFKKEMIYLFFKENILRDFYKNKYHKIINSNENFMISLKNFVQKIIDIYQNTFENKILLVIDNFNDNNKKEYEELEKIINIAKENSSKLKLIISGHSKFLHNKLKLFLENKNFFDTIDKQILINYDVKIETNKDNEIKSLPAFFFRKNIDENSFEDVLLKEEISYCQKFNVFGMNYSLMNENKKIEINDLLHNFDILPIDYLYLKIDDNYVTFNFHNQLFRKAIKKKIIIDIKQTSLEFLFKEVENDQIINGIFEEKLFILLISYNKLNLEDFKVNENNLLEVNELANLKNSSYNKTNKEIEIGNPIIITQENFKGQFYDLLILSGKIEDSKAYTAFLIQIGINKNKGQIEKIQNDFKENKNNYKIGIKKFIGRNINIVEIELIFIFDKIHQLNLKLKNENINEFGSKYCLDKKIKFYLYSKLDNYLYWTSDLKFYNKVYKFGYFNTDQKRKYKTYTMERFNFLTEIEKEFICIKKDYDTSLKDIFIKSEIINGIPKKLEKEIVYILKNEMNSYYIIDNIIYQLNNEEFKEVSRKDIEKNETFELFELFKKSNDLKKINK